MKVPPDIHKKLQHTLEHTQNAEKLVEALYDLIAELELAIHPGWNYRDIIDDLNEKLRSVLGHKGRYSPKAKYIRQLIHARLMDGFTPEDFYQVHTNMVARWGANPRMRRYLRPITLYAASKFDGYLTFEPTEEERNISTRDQDLSHITELAAAKVEKAMREGKGYQTVIFDDPAIHATLENMGGWSECYERYHERAEWFISSFKQRYRHLAMEPEARWPRQPKLQGYRELNGLPMRPGDYLIIGDHDAIKKWQAEWRQRQNNSPTEQQKTVAEQHVL